MTRFLWIEYDDSTYGPIVVLLTDVHGPWLLVEDGIAEVGSPRYHYALASPLLLGLLPDTECRWLKLYDVDHNALMAKGGEHLWSLASAYTPEASIITEETP